MLVNISITLVVVLAALASIVIEAYCIAKGIPTISDRIQKAGRSAPILGIASTAITVALLIHFFG
jgi:hypothetical protein